MLSRLRSRHRDTRAVPATADAAAAAAIGPRVLSGLAAYGLPADPGYYALVHTALSDPTSIAAHALHEATFDGRPLTRDAADAIIARLSPPEPSSAEDHALQDRLRHQTLHLADLAADAVAATSQFSRDLSAGLVEIRPDVHSVAAMITAMIERTYATEQRLAAAVRQIDDLRTEVAEARDDAMRDELTGLLNRRGILDRLSALDATRPRTLALCDIDAFKTINDSHGHQVGDRVLKVVADALAQGCSPHLVGRWGGEEFLVILDEPDPRVAAEIVDIIRGQLALRTLRVRETGAALGTATFSAGITPFGAEGFEPALRAADALLYQAKLTGRNRVLTELPTGLRAA